MTISWTITTSTELVERARRSIAGGDSSSMRVLPIQMPLVAERGDGARLWDVEGLEYIDMNSAYGPPAPGPPQPAPDRRGDATGIRTRKSAGLPFRDNRARCRKDQAAVSCHRAVAVRRYIDFQHHLQRAGVYVHPNMFEPMYLSSAHTRADIDIVLGRMADAAMSTLVQ